MSSAVALACEGVTDEAVLKRLLNDRSIAVGASYVFRGKVEVDQRVAGLKAASRHQRWLVLRDLDSDSECAPSLRRKLAIEDTPKFRLHIAVRQLESWILADSEGFAALIGVNPRIIPRQPDALPNAKLSLLEAVRRSRRARIRSDFLPHTATARVGQAYSARLIEFATLMWNPVRAAERSPSLESLVEHLESWR